MVVEKSSTVRISKITSNNSSSPSLIYIPKIFQQALKLRKGSYVKVFMEEGKLIIEPLNLNTEAQSFTSKKVLTGLTENTLKKVKGRPGRASRRANPPLKQQAEVAQSG